MINAVESQGGETIVAMEGEIRREVHLRILIEEGNALRRVLQSVSVRRRVDRMHGTHYNS